jgi:hypothetical protein
MNPRPMAAVSGLRLPVQGIGPQTNIRHFYHEKKDEQRDTGLGPEHDWNSHAADSFGPMTIAYEKPSRLANWNRPLQYLTPQQLV